MSSFDLEQAIAAWRRRLKSKRAFLADDLDELEGHIRDHIALLVDDGTDVRDAYYQAIDRLGPQTDLETEFRKVRFGKSKRTRSLARDWTLSFDMFKNYLKTALRSLARHKGFAAINLAGLAIGLAGAVLIGMYVTDELAYDAFHEKGDRIYRIGSSTVGWPYGQIIAEEFPEVEELVYMRTYPTYSIKHDQQLFFENMLYADAGFFGLFDFPLIDGDRESALAAPFTLVLSKELAAKYFGTQRAVGQSLILGDSLQFEVTGVVDVPRQSHIQFDVLLSFETLRSHDTEWYAGQMSDGWLNLNVVNYALLRQGTDADQFAAKIRDLPHERAAEFLDRFGSPYTLGLEPMREIYLHSPTGNALGPKSTIDYVYLLTAVGLFLLIIAALNFINLTTARSVDRAKEVGVRKVVGSTRGVLIRQFLGESMMMCLLAVILSVGVVWLALPSFNNLTLKGFGAADLFTVPVAVALVGLAMAVGLLAGFYPAFSLSSFRPVEVLKGRMASGRRGARLRRGLVVFQFAISGALILATLVVLGQIRYMQNRDLGFDGEQVLVLDARRAPGGELANRSELLKERLLSHPAVESVSAMTTVPGRSGWRGQISFPEGWPQGESLSLEYVGTDYDFVETLGLDLVAGRTFDGNFPPDAETAVVINESAVAAARWASAADAIGKGYASPGSRKPNGVVIGVVKDYHHHGLQEQIGPMMFGLRPANSLLAIRLKSAEAGGVIAHVEQTWNTFFAGYPFGHFFLDEDFAQQYASERRLMRIFTTFAALAIIIACLGLFALAAYSAIQRTKEIGVRKVLGASSGRITALLVRDFMRWVLIAFVLAAPVAYIAMSTWLQDFAYRMRIGADTFIAGAIIVMAIALLTVSYTAIRAALADPARSLRYE